MQLLQIKPMENVIVDQDRLGALYAQLGEAGAEDVVCRALEELADVSHCIDRRDITALAATLSRLIRVGERSLTAIWDLQDIPF